MPLPRYRTEHYAIWRACERLGMRPPGVKENWDDTDVWTQAMSLAFSQIREREDAEEHNSLVRAGGKLM